MQNKQFQNSFVCGIDECGRGCLAGPLVAGCVLWNNSYLIPVKDSKKISEKLRNSLYQQIKNIASYGIGWVWQFEIDKINIHNASLLAMQRAYTNMGVKSPLVLVDGKFAPFLNTEVRAIIKGDNSEPCISAASIIAKVTRDKWMKDYSKHEPNYHFENHKGYPTFYHSQAINIYGNSHIQRTSFHVPLKLR